MHPQRSIRRVAGLVLCVWLLVPWQTKAEGPATTRAADPSLAYRLEPGPYEVSTARVVLRDEKRGKNLLVTVCYPKEEGRFPVIVFSHGAGGSGEYYRPLVQFWVSHGYVCLLPTHADSLALKTAGTRRATLEDLRETVRDALTNRQGWLNRPRDITFLLDSVREIDRKVPELRGKMDMQRVGMSGHSFGAFTTQAVGGATVTLPGESAQSLSDARPRAFLMLSGQGPGQMGLRESSWEHFTRPLMSVTGTLDRGAAGQGYRWRRRAFELAPAGDKYFVLIAGANHFSFDGRDVEGGVLERALGVSAKGQEAISAYTKMITLAYWDAYLKDEPEAMAYLRSDRLREYSRGAATMERK
jgi:predicted dienelactone hydrolase